MKYMLVFALLYCLTLNCATAQWTTAGSNINYTTGIVSIGTVKAPTGFKLGVAGGIISEEVVIKLLANWPDYVFDQQYPLLSLEDLERYIREHKHLPEVPSAAAVENSGVNVGEMNVLLLKKIEELTLHVIALKKEVDELKR